MAKRNTKMTDQQKRPCKRRQDNEHNQEKKRKTEESDHRQEKKGRTKGSDHKQDSEHKRKRKTTNQVLSLEEEAKRIRESHPTLCEKVRSHSGKTRQARFREAMQAVLEMPSGEHGERLWDAYVDADLLRYIESDEEWEDEDFFSLCSDYENGIEAFNGLVWFLFHGCEPYPFLEPISLSEKANWTREAYLMKIRRKYKTPRDFAKRVALTCQNQDGMEQSLVETINHKEANNEKVASDQLGARWMWMGRSS